MIKHCQNCKQEFVIEPEDLDFYKKIDVPSPTWCPECRLVRRLVRRNERALYRGVCALCGEKSLSMYSQESGVIAYCVNCWNSDLWDPIDYGKEYDFSKPFFEQFKHLTSCVPRKILQTVNAKNSKFTNYTDNSKDVYMGFSIVVGSENVMYSKNIDHGSSIVDCFDVVDSQNSYFDINTEKNYNTFFVWNSRNCIDSMFLYDCVNCNNCILCTNLRNKSYYIRNKSFSREEYEEEIKKINLGSSAFIDKTIKEFLNIRKNTIHKYAFLTNCVNVSGDDVRNSKNTHIVFSGYDFEDSKYIFRSFSMKDSMDITNAALSELFYEFMSGGANSSKNIKFSMNGMKCMDVVEYTDFCGSSSHLFGCIGLRNKEYCILNKQYTKEEYEVLLPKIKQHMNDMPYVDSKGRIYKYGEFFPPELSPFAYNETIAQEYFPLTKEQAISQGYRWKDPDTKEYKITKKTNDLPDHIKDVPDSITNEIIECLHKGTCTHQCTTAFKIIPEELEFYRRMNLPLPRLCPNCRHYERLSQRNPLKLWHRKCMKEGCSNEFETSYSPERPEIVYCESCYQNEVV